MQAVFYLNSINCLYLITSYHRTQSLVRPEYNNYVYATSTKFYSVVIQDGTFVIHVRWTSHWCRLYSPTSNLSPFILSSLILLPCDRKTCTSYTQIFTNILTIRQHSEQKKNILTFVQQYIILEIVTIETAGWEKLLPLKLLITIISTKRAWHGSRAGRLPVRKL